MSADPTPSDVLTWRVVPAGWRAARNLVLVHERGAQDIADFERIRELVHERAHDIEVFIAHAHMPCSVTRRQAARRPSLVFSPTPFAGFKPRSGKVYAGQKMSKFEQVQRMRQAGVAVPETIAFDASADFDPATWGALTVLKPDWSGGGYSIDVLRTREITNGQRPVWPANDRRQGRPMIAQQFIDTGSHASKYRLLVLFGRPLYCEHQASVAPAPAIDPDGTGPITGLVTTMASTTLTAGTRRNTVCYDPDVLDLGSKVAAVFPEMALLGLDIIREAASGRLYVLEINPGGYTWHISSMVGKVAQQRQNIDRYAQFDALSVAADALIERTRAEAE